MKNIFVLIITLVLLFYGFYIFSKRFLNNLPTRGYTTMVGENNDSTPQPELKPAPLKEYSVPILMYHYVRDYNNPKDKIGKSLSVSPENFENQLRWLRDNGYESVNPEYLLNPYYLHTPPATPERSDGGQVKPIIITFDDGYSDAYTNAFPILQKYNFSATFYIITNRISNNPDYLNWDQVLEMKNARMNIGSHTLSHPDLTKAFPLKAEKEVSESKQAIKNKIGVEINDFCYPSGKYNDDSIDLVKKFGYNTSVTVKSGIANQNSNIFELPRIRITNISDLSKILN